MMLKMIKLYSIIDCGLVPYPVMHSSDCTGDCDSFRIRIRDGTIFPHKLSSLGSKSLFMDSDVISRAMSRYCCVSVV